MTASQHGTAPAPTRPSKSPAPKVLSYRIREHIANGGIASVYRALNSKTSQLAAIKIIPLGDPKDINAEREWKKVQREMRIHETLRHKNILRLIGGEVREQSGERGEWAAGLYIVLDLASGGDLFDKITPDIGVDAEVAHLYFRQLIDGLEYLGQEGICHRDIKPENCLLDGNGDLKISDFGLASVFKYKGKSRLLTDRCGSPPYAAPELAIAAAYAGEPVDMWSAGILLFTLLVGNTPWDEPTVAAPEFAAFVAGELVRMDPWNKIGGAAMRMLLRILEVDPAKRITIEGLNEMDWFTQTNPLRKSDGQCAHPAHVANRLAATLRRGGYIGAPTGEYESLMSDVNQNLQDGLPSASQMHFSQMGLDPTQSFKASMTLYSRYSQAPSQRTNPNVTRFFSLLPLPHILLNLSLALKKLNVPFKDAAQSSSSTVSHTFNFSTVDKRKTKLEGEIHISAEIIPGEEDGMDVDGGELRGYGVVLWKKDADPLELKRLWREIGRRLPNGMIHIT